MNLPLYLFLSNAIYMEIFNYRMWKYWKDKLFIQLLLHLSTIDFQQKIASFGWEKRIKRISTKIRCIFRFGKMIKRRARTTQIGNPWMNPDTNLKNIDSRQRDKLFLRSFLRSHEAARVVSGQAGGKSPFEAARSPLIAIWRFTFGPGYLAGSRRESTARENRKSPRGGWPRGRERGGGESPVERVGEGGCLPSGYIARPSAFDWRCPPFFVYFFTQLPLEDHMRWITWTN